MTPLAPRVYMLLQTVPAGRVTTYKALANAVDSKAYRAIGQLMKRNPHAPEVPCHRVVASDGTIGGYSGGVAKKIQMLRKEGVRVSDRRIVNFSSVFLSPKREARG